MDANESRRTIVTTETTASERFTPRDLKPPDNLKATFERMRNHLAGMATGITRDETLAKEIISLLLCKIYDETRTPPNGNVNFRVWPRESSTQVRSRICSLFTQKVKKEYSEVFDSDEKIGLDADSITYVVQELQDYSLRDANRDALADAFEIFIGPALRGAEGQFFTPRNVAKMMIEILDPSPGQRIIDPACGSGGFLILALEHLLRKLELAPTRGSSRGQTQDNRKEAAEWLRGIDKDSFLAKVAKAYMAIVGDGRGGVFCENSLKAPSEWHRNTQEEVILGDFDIVVTNPPHGARILVQGENILKQYELARRWKKDRATGDWVKTHDLLRNQTPQVLFIERCLQLLRPGGKLGIVLPESLIANPSHGYIVAFIRRKARFLGLVSMPEELFQPHTHNKTCVVFLEKKEPPSAYPIFMSIVKWCGHDSRGNRIPLDEVPGVAERYQRRMEHVKSAIPYDKLGFIHSSKDIKSNILVPKYYDPEILASLESLKQTHNLTPIEDLVKKGILSITTGVEIGRLSYGTGNIPFVRSSDIANWEIKIDPKQGVDESVYQEYGRDKGVRENDILMVRDGTYLVGTTAMVTKYDTKMLFQSHMYRLRVLRPEILSPYLFLALLSSPIVKRQVRAKQFTQDIIDTLGSRVLELVLPIPKDEELIRRIVEKTQKVVDGRADLRMKAKEVVLELFGQTTEP